MKRNTPKLIVVLFSLVLAGILLIQGWWVMNLLGMRSRQFDDAVNRALHATVAKLGQQENVTIIRKSLEPVKKKDRPKNRPKKIRIISDARVTHSKGKTVSSSYSYTIDSDSMRVQVATSGDKGTASTLIFNSDDADAVMELEAEEDSARIDKKMSDIKLLIDKIVVSAKDSAQLLPDGPALEKTLQTKLKENNIDLPFATGISLHDKHFYHSTGADTSSLYTSAYKTSLFPDDILDRKADLFVHFPGKQAYLFAGIFRILLLILLFTAIIIGLFAYTVIHYNRQKKLNQLKSDFINNLTHELKTPLATIQLASDVILKKEDDPGSAASQMAATIKLQSKKIDEDVRNMLQIALLENAGAQLVRYTTFSVYELLENCKTKLELLAAQKHLVVELYCDRGLQLEADRELIEKAINNLLDNAIKYSNEGGLVKITARSEAQQFLLEVADNGPGIAVTDLPHIFEKFYKAGKGNLHTNKGYGLGLSFVQKIALLHNGSISARSIAGKETVFTLQLPIKK